MHPTKGPYQKYLRKSLSCYLEELSDPLARPDEKNTLKDLKPQIMFLIKNGFNFPSDFFNFFKIFKVDSKKIKSIISNYKKSNSKTYNPSDRTISHATSHVINIILTYWCIKDSKNLFESIIYYVQINLNLNLIEFDKKLSELFNETLQQQIHKPTSEFVSPFQDPTILANMKLPFLLPMIKTPSLQV